MTVASLLPDRLTAFTSDRRLSTRTVALVFALLACLLYAIWHHTVPPGSVTSDVDSDTMCFIHRVGLGGLCR